MNYLTKLWNVSYLVVLMAIIRIGLRFMPLPKLLSWLSTPPKTGDHNLDALRRMASYTDRILTIFPYNEKGNCLPRSSMLYWLAPRYGYSVKFHCGVRKGETGLDGHAWLTMNGQTFLEPTPHSHGMVETFSHPKE